MCYAVTCSKCNKTTWKGCGRHVDSVMKNVPVENQCTCPRDGQGAVQQPADGQSASAGCVVI
ncbi:hypothetical protein BC936DRAFT_149465 [Jimgerdemannia flammicorona]|uniref:Uncharacterized protein n=1 Tax=Jimgerdemannia flammicorona TaxID=994334 RepID=A0A433D0R9_9FUNG|nr:hypothetical protein BC936DRAFT_149465 [Jimgerdemannia flammicorona]